MHTCCSPVECGEILDMDGASGRETLLAASLLDCRVSVGVGGEDAAGKEGASGAKPFTALAAAAAAASNTPQALTNSLHPCVQCCCATLQSRHQCVKAVWLRTARCRTHDVRLFGVTGAGLVASRLTCGGCSPPGYLLSTRLAVLTCLCGLAQDATERIACSFPRV